MVRSLINWGSVHLLVVIAMLLVMGLPTFGLTSSLSIVFITAGIALLGLISVFFIVKPLRVHVTLLSLTLLTTPLLMTVSQLNTPLILLNTFNACTGGYLWWRYYRC